MLVSLTLVDIYKKGKQKISETFRRKLFNTYHILPEGENTIDHEPDEEVEDAEVSQLSHNHPKSYSL